MYRWLNYKGKWKVVKIDGDSYKFFGIMMSFPTKEVPSELWGPYILEPCYVERREKQVVAVEVSDVENAADKDEENHELLGERYFCPDFVVNGKRQNDCGVVAVANVLGISYLDAKLKCFHAGWSSSRGISDGFCEQIIEEEGFYVCFRKDLTFGIVQEFRSEGTFLIHSPEHVMPAKNSTVHNQQSQGNMRISEVWEIRK